MKSHGEIWTLWTARAELAEWFRTLSDKEKLEYFMLEAWRKHLRDSAEVSTEPIAKARILGLAAQDFLEEHDQDRYNYYRFGMADLEDKQHWNVEEEWIVFTLRVRPSMFEEKDKK